MLSSAQIRFRSWKEIAVAGSLCTCALGRGAEAMRLQAKNASASRPGLARRVFLAGGRLRAGWGLLLFLLLFAALIIGVHSSVSRFHLQTEAAVPGFAEITAHETILSTGWQLAALLLITLLMSVVERRSFTGYGLPRARMLSDVGAGLLWGIVMLSLLVGGLVLTRSLRFNGVMLGPSSALVYAGKWFAAFFFVGLLEEFWFRGYLLFTLARGVRGIANASSRGQAHARAIGFWVAALIMCFFFVLSHAGNRGESSLGNLSAAIAGIVFAFSLYRTGSLWWAIGFHTAWDWAQSYLYGVANSGSLARGRLLSAVPVGPPLLSGGTAGPEGSILVVPTLLLVALVIHFTLPRRDLGIA